MENKAEQLRPNKVDYYMNITKQVAERSNCLSTKLGAVIVKEDQIISTGYNGAPRKTKDCMDHGSCLRRERGIPSGQRYELCRSVHAEQNALLNAARSGVSLLGGTLYMYGMKIYNVDEPTLIDAVPCFICKKLVINAGIKEVVVMMKDGTVKTFQVDDWVGDWSKNDMTDDVVKFDCDYWNKK